MIRIKEQESKLQLTTDILINKIRIYMYIMIYDWLSKKCLCLTLMYLKALIWQDRYCCSTFCVLDIINFIYFCTLLYAQFHHTIFHIFQFVFLSHWNLEKYVKNTENLFFCRFLIKFMIYSMMNFGTMNGICMIPDLEKVRHLSSTSDMISIQVAKFEKCYIYI